MRMQESGNGGRKKERRREQHLPVSVWVSVVVLLFRCLRRKLSQYFSLSSHSVRCKKRGKSNKERACPVKPLRKLVSDFEPLRLKRVLKNTKQQLCLRNEIKKLKQTNNNKATADSTKVL